MIATHFLNLALMLCFAASLSFLMYASWRLRNVHRAHRQRMVMLKSIRSADDLKEFQAGLTYKQHVDVLMALGNPWRSYGALGARVQKEFGRKA